MEKKKESAAPLNFKSFSSFGFGHCRLSGRPGGDHGMRHWNMRDLGGGGGQGPL